VRTDGDNDRIWTSWSSRNSHGYQVGCIQQRHDPGDLRNTTVILERRGDGRHWGLSTRPKPVPAPGGALKVLPTNLRNDLQILTRFVWKIAGVASLQAPKHRRPPATRAKPRGFRRRTPNYLLRDGVVNGEDLDQRVRRFRSATVTRDDHRSASSPAPWRKRTGPTDHRAITVPILVTPEGPGEIDRFRTGRHFRTAISLQPERQRQPGHMSPEQAGAPASIDHPGRIYAWEERFAGADGQGAVPKRYTFAEELAARQTQPPPRCAQMLEDSMHELAACLHGCLTAAPKTRYPTSQH